MIAVEYDNDLPAYYRLLGIIRSAFANAGALDPDEAVIIHGKTALGAIGIPDAGAILTSFQSFGWEPMWIRR